MRSCYSDIVRHYISIILVRCSKVDDDDCLVLKYLECVYPREPELVVRNIPKGVLIQTSNSGIQLLRVADDKTECRFKSLKCHIEIILSSSRLSTRISSSSARYLHKMLWDRCPIERVAHEK